VVPWTTPSSLRMKAFCVFIRFLHDTHVFSIRSGYTEDNQTHRLYSRWNAVRQVYWQPTVSVLLLAQDSLFYWYYGRWNGHQRWDKRSSRQWQTNGRIPGRNVSGISWRSWSASFLARNLNPRLCRCRFAFGATRATAAKTVPSL